MTKKILLVAVMTSCIASSSWAIGPRNVTSGGSAVKWGSMPVTVHLETDMDVRGKDVLPLVQEALNTWADLSESDVTFTQGTLSAAVDNSNVCCFVFDPSACASGPTSDGTNPLVIDEDGDITASFFGVANKFTTLGFASIITFNSTTGEAVKGEAIFNAACLAGNAVSGCERGAGSADDLSFSDDDFTSFIVHEIGHLLGLDHSQVNLTEATDGDSSNNGRITTMFPTFIVGNGSNFKTPEKDDKVGLAQLYPASGFASSTWKVTGTVFRTDGTTPLQCANVIARGTADPRVDAVSALSGDFSPAGSAVGTYEILGLTAGQAYTVEVESIGSTFTGASGYTPCRGSSGESAPPQFTSQAPATTYTHAGGETEAGVNFTVTGLSSLVLEEDLATLDLDEEASSEEGAIEEDIAALELTYNLKDASPACSSGSGSSDSGGGGCSLIRP